MKSYKYPVPRLMGSISADSDGAERANVSVVGVPFNGASNYYGSGHHPTEQLRISGLSDVNEGKSPWLGQDAYGLVVIDHGDIEYDLGYNADAMSKAVVPQLKSILTRNTIVLGGDHSIGYPIAKAAKLKLKKPIYHLVIDAHSDLWGEGQEALGHGNWLRLAIEDGYSSGAAIFGARSRGHVENDIDYRENYNCKLIAPDDCLDIAEKLSHSDGWPGDEPCWLSIDLDGIDPAFAPGVNTAEPGGLTSRETFRLISKLFSNYNIVGGDIVEFYPQADINTMTAQLAGGLIRDMIIGLGHKENAWNRSK